MAKVAITEHRGRISPVFDVASSAEIIELEGQAEIGRSRVALRAQDPLGRALELSAIGVQTLICGAVSRGFEEALVGSGLRVIGFLCGPVDEVLSAFISGVLSQQELAEKFAMPGCCGRRRGAQIGKGGKGMRRGNTNCRRNGRGWIAN